jgi:hypothetical protein
LPKAKILLTPFFYPTLFLWQRVSLSNRRLKAALINKPYNIKKNESDEFEIGFAPFPWKFIDYFLQKT